MSTKITISASYVANADGTITLSIPAQSLKLQGVKPTGGAGAYLTVTMPDGTAGQPYTGQLTETGLKAPAFYGFSPPLPAGMSLNAQTGAVTGTPSGQAAYSGTASSVGADGIGTTKAVSFNIAAAAPGKDNIGAPGPDVIVPPADA